MVVGIAAGYGLELEVRFAVSLKDFSLLQSVQIDSKAHSASYPMNTGGTFFANKEIIHLHLVARSTIMVLHLHSPIRLYSVVIY
jgi:hypothetical protein